MTPVSGTWALCLASNPTHGLTREIHPMLSQYWASISTTGTTLSAQGRFEGVVNCQNSRDKGPPEGNSARG